MQTRKARETGKAKSSGGVGEGWPWAIALPLAWGSPQPNLSLAREGARRAAERAAMRVSSVWKCRVKSANARLRLLFDHRNIRSAQRFRNFYFARNFTNFQKKKFYNFRRTAFPLHRHSTLDIQTQQRDCRGTGAYVLVKWRALSQSLDHANTTTTTHKTRQKRCTSASHLRPGHPLFTTL